MSVSVSVKIEGLGEVRSGLAAVIAAFDLNGQQKNFRTIMRFVRDECVTHTPGTKLKTGWFFDAVSARNPDGWTFMGRVANNRVNERLFYFAAISGERKPKLKANDEQQTYGDIIPFLDAGTRPHKILPRRYANLVFRTSAVPRAGDPDRSNLVITKGVSHPGTKAYGTLSRPYAKLLTLAEAAILGVEEQVVKAW